MSFTQDLFEFNLLLRIYSNFSFLFEQIKTQLLTFLIYYTTNESHSMQAGRQARRRVSRNTMNPILRDSTGAHESMHEFR